MADPKTLSESLAGAPMNIDLETLGLSEIAYLKAATVDGVPGFAIFAANGVAIGFSPGENAAIAAVLTNDMDVAAVH